MTQKATQGQELLDRALAAIVQGKKGYFLLARTTNRQRQLLLMGKRQKAFVVKLRLILEAFERKKMYDETDLEYSIILSQGNSSQTPFFILSNSKLEYCASSFDERTALQLTAFMTTIDPFANLEPQKVDSVPVAMRAQFNNCGPMPPVGAIALVKDSTLATLWDYDMELIRPSYAPINVAAEGECEEENDEDESFQTGRCLHW